MNCYSKRGISLVALMATITILVILITTVTVSGVNSSNNAKKITFATEISNIQESVDAYKINNNGDYPAGDIEVVDLSNVTTTAKQQFSDEEIVDNKITLYAVDYNKINVTSLKYGNKVDGDTDIYALSQDTGKVYYIKGLNIGKTTYFALTDDLKKAISYNTASQDNNVDDGIIFSSSDTKWTNKKVSVTVKIPVGYNDVSVKVGDKAYSIDTSSSNSTYNVYNISDMDGNYQVDVAYTANSQSRSAKYNVNNVDTKSPDISIDTSNQKLIAASDSSSTYAYVNILSKSDDLSGIKIIKYENEKIESNQVETYFKSNGKTVTGNSIPIEKNAMYETVYVEDNAGNWTVSYITVDNSIYTGLLK